MNNGTAKIQIYTDENCYTHVYLDGNEVDGVTALNLHMEVNALPLLVLAITARDVDVVTEGEFHKQIMPLPDVLEQPLNYLDLSTRSYNAIMRGTVGRRPWEERNDNVTVGDVLKAYRSGDLREYRNFGSKSYEEVVEKLKSLGLIGEESNGQSECQDR